MRPAMLLYTALLVTLLAGSARGETYRGLSATVAAFRMPINQVKDNLRRGTLEAGGLPAVILRTRLLFNRGREDRSFARRLEAALSQPVGSCMKVAASPSVPVYKAQDRVPRQRPASAPAVKDLTTGLVDSLRKASGSSARRSLLQQHKASGFDRNALGRLLGAHRFTQKGNAPIVFATEAYKAQARNGEGVLVASGGSDVYMVMDNPKQLLTKGRVGFTLVGGQPRTANMGLTAGSSVSFQVDRRGQISNIDVVGRGDVLLLNLSSQLQRDIKSGARTGSKADPRDMLALVNHAAPKLLQKMVDAPKPAVLFRPMPGWVPFAPLDSK